MIYQTEQRNIEIINKLYNKLRDISGTLFWCSLWLFFICLNSCNGTSSYKQQEIINELQKQNKILEAYIKTQQVEVINENN